MQLPVLLCHNLVPEHCRCRGSTGQCEVLEVITCKGSLQRDVSCSPQQVPKAIDAVSLHTCRHRGPLQNEFYLSDDLADELEPASSAHEAGPDSLSFGGWTQEHRQVGRLRVGQQPGRTSGTDGEGSHRCGCQASRVTQCDLQAQQCAGLITFPLSLSLPFSSPMLRANHAGCLLSSLPPVQPQFTSLRRCISRILALGFMCSRVREIGYR